MLLPIRPPCRVLGRAPPTERGFRYYGLSYRRVDYPAAYGYPGPRRRRRAFLYVAIGIAVAAVVGVIFLFYLYGAFGPSPIGGHPYFGLFGGFLVLFILIWVAFFVLRIAFWSSRSYGGGNRRPGWGPDPAVMAARQRYARGEISREQFDQIMTDLGRRGRGPGGPLSGGGTG